MKNLLKQLMLIAIVFSFASCSTEALDADIPEDNARDTQCSGEEPISRMTNNSTQSVNFEIFNHQGVLINHAYNVPPGQDSGWLSFNNGETSFKVSTAVSTKLIVIDMGDCMSYDVAINSENQLDNHRATTID